ncbi:hypothetical protein B0H19DRAFT_1083527 [Mycena capillaripes]|nr:hypothetical protein B0H19DRAFT_1083527 [Mycena capillaripes]
MSSPTLCLCPLLYFAPFFQSTPSFHYLGRHTFVCTSQFKSQEPVTYDAPIFSKVPHAVNRALKFTGNASFLNYHRSTMLSLKIVLNSDQATVGPDKHRDQDVPSRS